MVDREVNIQYRIIITRTDTKNASCLFIHYLCLNYTWCAEPVYLKTIQRKSVIFPALNIKEAPLMSVFYFGLEVVIKFESLSYLGWVTFYFCNEAMFVLH